MFKLPRRVQIRNKSYKVRYMKLGENVYNATEILGLCDSANRLILINPKCKKNNSELSVTFFHEVFHAIINEYQKEIIDIAIPLKKGQPHITESEEILCDGAAMDFDRLIKKCIV